MKLPIRGRVAAGWSKSLAQVALIFFALTSCLGIDSALAQQKTMKEELIGSWILAAETLILPDGRRIASWGDNPFGFLSFDAVGYFSQMLIRSDLPRFVVRTRGTPEQNDAVAKGSISYYGSYAVEEAASVVNVHIIGSSFATFNGSDGRRKIVFLGPDELMTTHKIPGSDVVAELVWKRGK